MFIALSMSMIFGVATYLIYKISKDNVAPHYIMFFTWTFYMIMLIISSKYYFPISFLTCSIYWVGVSCFLLGYLLFNSLFIKNTKNLNGNQSYKKVYITKEKRIKIMLWATILILFIGLIPYYNKQVIQSGASITDLRSFFWKIRHADLSLEESGGFSIINNLPIICRIVTIYFYYLYRILDQKNKIANIILISLCIIYCVLTGGRAEIVKTLLALIGIEVICYKRWINKRNIIIGFLVLLVSSIFAYYYGKSSINNKLSFVNNINQILEDILFYTMSGVLAFNNIIEGIIKLPYNGGVFRFFMQTANSFGANIKIESLFMPFSQISDTKFTNVYTIYGDYNMHFGLFGICFFTFVLGFVLAFIYSKVKSGKTVWIILYAQMISNIIMSGYADAFYHSLNFQIKLILVVLLYESIICKKIRFKKYIEC